MFKLPQDDERYSWTWHVIEKMKYYSISPSRVKRVIRAPTRTEEGIALNTIAVMQPAGTKRYQEIWIMYRLDKRKEKQKGRIRIITVWRYPGKSSERNPIPKDILEEVKSLL